MGGDSIPETIDVPPWMLREGQPVSDTGSLTQGSAISIDQAGVRLAKVLAEAGGVLGWKSDGGAMEARTRLDHADGQIGALRDLVNREASAWSALAGAMRERQPSLVRLVRERGQIMGVANVPGSADKRERVLQIDREIREHTGALALADRTARDELRAVVDGYRALTAVDREDEWVASAAPGEVNVLLGRYGITESDTERALLDKIMLLPDGPAGDAELRALLAGMSPAEAADFLLRHPDVARRLGGPLGPAGSYPADSPEGGLADALERGKNLPPKERIALIRAAFAAMSPQEQQRMALLYPDVVGNLDGAPLPVRMAANRVKIGVALDDERQRYVDTQRAVDGQDLQWSDEYRSGEPFVGVDTAETDAERNARRIDYYGELLFEEPLNPNYVPGSGRPHSGPHQILYFDNAGDGKIAEMWGTYDAGVDNVAVWVPGITADMENFANTSGRAYDLADSDPTGSTVTIAWMGVDMPDSAAGVPLYDEGEAAARGEGLRDFVWGLGIPPEKRVTAIGHSYGGVVVGSADKLGMDVDAVVHLASVGAGSAVNTTSDYPADRDVERYSMVTPSDTIDPVAGRAWGANGRDPAEMYGFHQLEPGRYSATDPDPAKAGQKIDGHPDQHSDVAGARGSDAWNNIVGVVTGGNVTTTDGRSFDVDCPPE